jgi:hypothetical protein
MNIIECSTKLQQLSKAYANYTMSLEDYRRDRKVLLDALDLTINGIEPNKVDIIQTPTIEPEQDVESHNNNDDEQLDKTQPYFARKIDKCMSFIKGSNKS